MLTLLVVAVAAAVVHRRDQVARWMRDAIGRGGTTEKAVALDLGRDLGQLSRMLSAGTLQVADLLAMPPQVRDLALMTMTRHVGLVTVRDFLLQEMADRERRVLETLAPHGRAVRCEACGTPSRADRREVA